MSVLVLKPQRDDWETPQHLFDALQTEFGFTLDVCATYENTKVANSFFSPEEDGLAQSWDGHVCWMNPPYGRAIAQWVAKARAEGERGTTVVALLPARTDTEWWHEDVQGIAEVKFLRGRVEFRRRDGKRSRAPFASAIAVYRSRRTAGA